MHTLTLAVLATFNSFVAEIDPVPIGQKTAAGSFDFHQIEQSRKVCVSVDVASGPVRCFHEAALVEKSGVPVTLACQTAQ